MISIISQSLIPGCLLLLWSKSESGNFSIIHAILHLRFHSSHSQVEQTWKEPWAHPVGPQSQLQHTDSSLQRDALSSAQCSELFNFNPFISNQIYFIYGGQHLTLESRYIFFRIAFLIQKEFSCSNVTRINNKITNTGQNLVKILWILLKPPGCPSPILFFLSLDGTAILNLVLIILWGSFNEESVILLDSSISSTILGEMIHKGEISHLDLGLSGLIEANIS